MESKKIEFIRTMNVKAPQRAHGTDAGADMFVPEYSPEFEAELQGKNPSIGRGSWEDAHGGPCILLGPGERILIPSGVKMHILDPDTYVKIENKSGVASKKGLVVGANVIDAGYTGVVHISLINTGRDTCRIDYGEKIVQAIQMPYIRSEYKEVTEEEFGRVVSERGSGGFGSTGTK